MAKKESLSGLERLETVLGKAGESKVFTKLSQRFGKKQEDNRFVLDVLNLSESDKQKIQATIMQLRQGIADKQTSIQRDEATVKKLESLL
jgi:hypothetical protein